MEDPRIADIIVNDHERKSVEANVVIIGFPHDEGVRRNGGRVGAKDGPASFRKLFYRLCSSDTESGVDLSQLKIVDFGDVDPSLPLEQAHLRLTELVHRALYIGGIPIIIGGGNDQSYPNASALIQNLLECKSMVDNTQQLADQKLHVINVDAHLDVRPLKNGQVHSGSPFRLLIEDDRFSKQLNGKYSVYAAQGPQCASRHVEYIKQSGNQVMFLSAVKTSLSNSEGDRNWLSAVADTKATSIFVSFDIDSIRASDCPGVSCSSPDGLSAEEAIMMCKQAGGDGRVRLIDFSEYNPTIEEYRTGRLLAIMVHAFLCGLTQRQQRKQ
ncbi:hypothetical protein MIR68_005770 [Amoeboaphelidium protococcarum]|nr:hypothetical protein MIR68_005770 [Amoeboaphelidium protococcarum]